MSARVIHTGNEPKIRRRTKRGNLGIAVLLAAKRQLGSPDHRSVDRAVRERECGLLLIETVELIGCADGEAGVENAL